MANNGDLYLSGSAIFTDYFEYSSYLDLPATATLPSWWTVSVGDFTTVSHQWLEVLEPGEMVYSGESLLDLSVLQTGNANFAFIITFMTVRDLKLELRLRRSDAQNFIALEVDYENQTLKLKKTVAGVETVLDVQDFVWDSDTSAYGIELWVYNDRIEGRVNHMPFVSAYSDFNQTIPGFSLYVPEFWSTDKPRFYKLWIYDVDAYPEPTLEDSNDIMVLARKEYKAACEYPCEYTWDTFKTARSIHERARDYGRSDLEWSNLGYPIREPDYELWNQRSGKEVETPSSLTISPSEACSAGGVSITLDALGGFGETVRWYLNDCETGSLLGEGKHLVVEAPSSPIGLNTIYGRWESHCGIQSDCLSVEFTIHQSPFDIDNINYYPDCYELVPSSLITLTAVGGSGDTLTWYENTCSGVPIATGNDITVSPTTTTTYWAQWKTNYCGDSDCQSVTINVIVPPTFYVMPESTGIGAEPPGDNFYHVGGLSDDGKYVMLTMIKSGFPPPITEKDQSIVVEVATLTEYNIIYREEELHFPAYGRGCASVGGVFAAAGAGYGGSIHNRGCASNVGSTHYGNLLALIPTAGGAITNCEVSKMNSLSLYMEGPSTGNGWVVGNRTYFSVDEFGQPNDHRDHGCAWQYTNGVVEGDGLTAKFDAAFVGETKLLGVSSLGVAAGYDRNNVGDYNRPFWANVTDGSFSFVKDEFGNPTTLASHACRYIPSFSTSTIGQAIGVSANSQYICGYFKIEDSSNEIHGFRYDVNSAYPTVEAVELFPIGGYVPTLYQQSAAYDVASNGTAVGYSWRSDTSRYTATVWRGNNIVGESLEEILSHLGVNISTYGFEYLERIISITYDAKTIAGRGHLLADPDPTVFRVFVITFDQPLSSSYPNMCIAPDYLEADHEEYCEAEYALLNLSAVGGQGDSYSSSVKWYTGSCEGDLIGSGTSITVEAPLENATYYARWEGCSVSACSQLDITVHQVPLPPDSASADPTYICSNYIGNLQLSASGGTGDVFRWYSGSCGGSLVGEGQILTITPPVATTTYFGRWESLYGCGNSNCVSVSVPYYVAPTDPISAQCDKDDVCPGA